MSNEGYEEEDFKLITYRRGKKSSRSKILSKTQQTHSSEEILLNQDVLIRRIQEAKSEIGSSDLFASTLASLREGIATLLNPTIQRIVCFGLGNIDVYNVSVKVYDPIFTKLDFCLLEKFNCDIFEENCEGKYQISDKCTTIFYMPHCSKQLTNNLLWANWGLNLNYCIIVANSFHTVVESTPKRLLNVFVEYIANILPHMDELAIINSFRLQDIFNDTAIHIFPWNKINLLSDDFWSLRSEPVYSDDDVEFIARLKKLKIFGGRMSSNINTLRKLVSELRNAQPSGALKNNLAVQYILSQYRKHKTTSEQLCKDREEMEFMAKTYLCYLKSSRLHQEIHNEFHGKGERTVRETANLVGFKLPHDPK